jgi:hypothetical protein
MKMTVNGMISKFYGIRWLGMALCLALSCVGTAYAQANLFPDDCQGDVTVPLGNYWDGVDDQNYLRVNVANSPVLNDVGRMVDTPQSSFPNVADINDDGLPDLLVADTYGFLWIYINSGEKGAPKFTQGQLVPTYLGWGSKIHVTDWDGDRDLDVLVGTYYGDVAVLENLGTVREPRFTRSMGVPRYVVPFCGVDRTGDRLPQINLGKEPLLFGNYMSPWASDWRNKGSLDLLLGEGTYSANSVRILYNTGSRNRPNFIPEQTFFLAFGEGFEHLTPAVVDYNGDGIDDLIVGTRTGEIRKYKGTKEAIEGRNMVAAIRSTLAPAAMEFDGFLEIGGKKIFSKMSNAFPYDWNNDGLFDLVLGHTDGRIYVALNKGSKTEPNFPTVEAIKGVNTDKDLLAPKGWWPGIGREHKINIWFSYHWDWVGMICNAAVLLSAENFVVLQPGVPPITPEHGDRFIYFRYVKDYLGWTRSQTSPYNLNVQGGRWFGLQEPVLIMKIGHKYEFSFSSVLVGKQASWHLMTWETFPGTATQSIKWERHDFTGNIRVSRGWQKNSLKFTCPGVGKNPKDPKLRRGSSDELKFYLIFKMPEGDGQLLLDNFKLVELP